VQFPEGFPPAPPLAYVTEEAVIEVATPGPPTAA